MVAVGRAEKLFCKTPLIWDKEVKYFVFLFLSCVSCVCQQLYIKKKKQLRLSSFLDAHGGWENRLGRLKVESIWKADGRIQMWQLVLGRKIRLRWGFCLLPNHLRPTASQWELLMGRVSVGVSGALEKWNLSSRRVCRWDIRDDKRCPLGGQNTH